jgi:hypothetical protein
MSRQIEIPSQFGTAILETVTELITFEHLNYNPNHKYEIIIIKALHHLEDQRARSHNGRRTNVDTGLKIQKQQ